MGDVESLLTQYIERYLAGESTDPTDLLDQLEGKEREELESLIDAFLVDAPARPWNADEYAGSIAEHATEELIEQGTLWPAVLPSLRERLEIRRRDLATRLANALGHADQEEKVERYYHQMETGQLDPDGVSDQVLEALGSILGRSAEALRSLGEGLGPQLDETPVTAYTRLTQPQYSIAAQRTRPPSVRPPTRTGTRSTSCFAAEPTEDRVARATIAAWRGSSSAPSKPRQRSRLHLGRRGPARPGR